jgi:hypothetical protein
MNGLPALALERRLDTIDQPGLRLENGTLSWVFRCVGTPDVILANIAKTTGAARSSRGIAGPLNSDRCLLAVTCEPDTTHQNVNRHDTLNAELTAILEGHPTRPSPDGWTKVKAIACDPSALLPDTWFDEQQVPAAAAYRALAGVALACGTALPTEVQTVPSATVEHARQRQWSRLWRKPKPGS